MAQKFAAEGCNVAINYVSSKDAAEKLASDLQAQYNVKAVTVQAVGFCELCQGDSNGSCVLGGVRMQVSRVIVPRLSKRLLSYWEGWIS